METKLSPLLHWLLQRHPDSPKSRAKQWIVAGRVSVNGVVIRKPHQLIADPGDALELGDRHATSLECGSGWQIHPRVSLLYLDSAVAIANKGPGLISVPAPNCSLSALSILADFLAGKLKPGTAASPESRCRPSIAGSSPCRFIASTNTPAASSAWRRTRRRVTTSSSSSRRTP
jgi:hypothetical protein